MASCAFFGHSDFDYAPFRERLKETIVDLIENKDVTEFYSGGRGKFEKMCAHMVYQLSQTYPHIKNILVMSYRPGKNFELSYYYDESVYLLEKPVLARFAISYTNQKLVQSVDYVVSGVVRGYGGAYAACKYAKNHFRTVINVVTGEKHNYISDSELELVEKIAKQHQERLATDEQYKKDYDEECKRIYEKISPKINKQIAKNKRKKPKQEPTWVKIETKTTKD